MGANLVDSKHFAELKVGGVLVGQKQKSRRMWC